MKKRSKRIIVIAGVILAVGAIFLASYLPRFNAYKDAIANITYQNKDAAAVPDGIYFGECDVDFISAKVSVTVKSGIITHIALLEHQNGRGAAAEGIVQVIVEKQLINVDSVSGATNSSDVIKKAVDNALSSARKI